jgi:RimJ/RimL family protein N-acetyltransferase
MITLREVVDEDLPIFFANQSDRESYELADYPPKDREAFDAHWARIRADDSNWTRTIVADGAVVGTMMCFVRDGVQEVGYWIGREYWGRGYASQALALFLPLVPVRPLYANLVRTNVGSRRVLEKNGFTVVSDEDGELKMRLD